MSLSKWLSISGFTGSEAPEWWLKEGRNIQNGQLKPAYNVQIAVENYFIIHGYVSNDRTDYNTLISVLEKHKKAFGEVPDEVTADSGYCSEKKLFYLKKGSPVISSCRAMKSARPAHIKKIII